MIETFLNQKATYWIGKKDGYGGYTWSTPTTIDVRWSEESEVVKDDMGEEVVSKSKVWMKERLPYKDKAVRLYKGETEVSDPQEVDSFKVITRKSRTDLDGNNDGYKVWL